MTPFALASAFASAIAGAIAGHGDRARSALSGEARLPLLVFAVFVLAVAYYWNGLGAGDEVEYINTARRYNLDGAHLGDTHWSLRHLMTLPMGLSFTLFGFNEFAATLPNILYALGLVAVTFFFARRYCGETEAAAMALVIAVSCFFVARPIEVDVYGVEALFAALAVWLFIASLEGPRALARLAAAGGAAGLAWTVRETSASICIALAALTLAFHRKRFFAAGVALAAGFFAVLLAEFAFYAIAAGDPLYRITTDLVHKEVGSAAAHTARPSGLDRLILPFKDILTAPSLTPFLIALAPAAALLHFSGAFAPSRLRSVLAAFAIAGCVALIVSAWGLRLAMPNYYPVFAYAIFIALGAALAALWRKSRLVAGAAFLGIVAANFLVEDFRDYDDWSEARLLATIAQSSPEPIATHPAIAVRARVKLQMRGMSEAGATTRIPMTENPASGALYFRGWASGHAPAVEGAPIEAWAPLRPSPTHAALRRIGIGANATGRLGRVIGARPEATLMRVGDPPPAE